MKQKFFLFLSAFVIFIDTIQIANASASNYKINKPVQVWEQSAPYDVTKQFRQAAIVNDTMYVLPAPNSESELHKLTNLSGETYYVTKGYRFGENMNEVWSAGGPAGFAYLYTNSTAESNTIALNSYAGPAFAADDAGNLYAKSVKTLALPVATAWAEPMGGITSWLSTALPGSGIPGTKYGVDFSAKGKIARADFMSANGDGVNGTAYLWFTPNGSSTITRVEVTQKAVTSAHTLFNIPTAVGECHSLDYVNEYAIGKLIYNDWASTSGKLYRGTYASGSTIVTWEDLGLNVYAHGATAFELAGHEIIAYSSSSTQVTLYDYTARSVIATISPFPNASIDSYVTHSLNAIVSDNLANFYVWVPGVGAKKYTITASAITDSDLSEYYVYIKNTENWEQPYAFAYNSVDTSTYAFPGEPMVQQSNGLWKYEVRDSSVPTKIIFSDNGMYKTLDLDYINAKIYDCSGKVVGDGTNPICPTIQDIKKESIDSIVDWNDMSSPHQIKITGTYLNETGDKGAIYYSVNNGDWIICTDTIAPGDTFNCIINPSFNPDYKYQSIKLRARDIANMFSVIDETIITNINSFNVSGLNSMEYTGNVIELPGLIVTDPSTSLILTKDVDYSVEYSNNINAGTANTIIKGVYPNTIGTSIYNFKILPTPIDGTISFVVTDTTYVFNKCEICPEVKIYDNRFGELVKNKDYAVSYKNNIYPGNAYVYVNGLGNFSKNDSISTSFEIKRRDLTVSDIIVNVPENLMYDGDCHGIIITPIEGMGEYTITYFNEDSIIVDSIPSEPGIYSASLQISEGAYYNAINIDNIAQYTIYEANEDDWNALIALYNSTNGATWINTWNVANGIKAMSKLYGVTFDKGRVKSIVLPDNNLSGGIPAEIFSLPMLESLNLSKNLLTGNMPSITSSPIKNIDISNNALTGNIGEFISMLPNIERIKASNNCISQILPAFDKNNINVDLNNQILNDTITLNMTSNASLLMSLYTIPNVITYNSDGAYRMALTTDKDSANFKLAMVYTNGQLQYNILSNSNVFTGKNGSYIHVVSNNPITEGSLITAQLLFTDGDADFSSSVNVLDVQALLLFTFKEFNVNPFNFTAANLYTDEIINVQDVVRLVNLLLAQEVSIPIESYSAQQNDAVVYWRGNELVLNTNKEVAAFEIVTTGATEMNWGVVRNGFTASSRQIDEYNRTIVYSLMGSTLPIGETVIATANDVNTPKVVNAILSSADAQSINVGCNRKDISSIEALEDKILSVHQEDNTLVLSSGEYLGNVECKVYSSDGTLLSLKKLDIVESGENVVIANYVKNNKVVFVHIISETAGNIVKKVIIK